MFILGVMGIAMTTGCVTGRRTVDLAIPSLESRASNNLSATVNMPLDARRFENDSSDPSTPSISGDVRSLSTSEKALMIGRQRNAYGMAMGDVALPTGESVTKKMRQLVMEGLRSRGYRIKDKGGDYIVNVKLEKFWGWFTPGVFGVKLEARLKSAITLSRGSNSKVLVVDGYGINKAQIASNNNWELAYQRAFEDFLKNIDSAMDKQGL